MSVYPYIYANMCRKACTELKNSPKKPKKVGCFPENSASVSAGRSIPGLQASGLKFNMELSFDLRNNNFDVRKSFSAVWEHAGTH
jgi:hypothetical protein